MCVCNFLHCFLASEKLGLDVDTLMLEDGSVIDEDCNLQCQPPGPILKAVKPTSKASSEE